MLAGLLLLVFCTFFVPLESPQQGFEQNTTMDIKSQSYKMLMLVFIFVHLSCFFWFFLPDIVLVSKHDDGASVGRLQQTHDNLIELAGARLPKDLQRLSDADSA